jgi:hypothetical protein
VASASRPRQLPETTALPGGPRRLGHGPAGAGRTSRSRADPTGPLLHRGPDCETNRRRARRHPEPGRRADRGTSTARSRGALQPQEPLRRTNRMRQNASSTRWIGRAAGPGSWGRPRARRSRSAHIRCSRCHPRTLRVPRHATPFQGVDTRAEGFAHRPRPPSGRPQPVKSGALRPLDRRQLPPCRTNRTSTRSARGVHCRTNPMGRRRILARDCETNRMSRKPRPGNVIRRPTKTTVCRQRRLLRTAGALCRRPAERTQRASGRSRGPAAKRTQSTHETL